MESMVGQPCPGGSPALRKESTTLTNDWASLPEILKAERFFFLVLRHECNLAYTRARKMLLTPCALKPWAGTFHAMGLFGLRKGTLLQVTRPGVSSDSP